MHVFLKIKKTLSKIKNVKKRKNVARIKNVNKVFLHLCCRTNWQMSVCKNERKTKSRRYPRYDS